MRAHMFRHLQRLPLGYFDRIPSGVDRLAADQRRAGVNELLSNGTAQAFTDILTLISTVAVMLCLAPQPGAGDVRGDAAHGHRDLDLHRAGQGRLPPHPR